MGEENSVDVYYSHIKHLSDARIGELRADAVTRSMARAARAARVARRREHYSTVTTISTTRAG